MYFDGLGSYMGFSSDLTTKSTIFNISHPYGSQQIYLKCCWFDAFHRDNYKTSTNRLHITWKRENWWRKKSRKKDEFNLQNRLGEEAPVRHIMEVLTKIKCIKNIYKNTIEEEVLMATAAGTPNSTKLTEVIYALPPGVDFNSCLLLM